MACGDNNAGTATIAATEPAADPADGGFCEAIAHLIVLLSPTDDSSPTETEATFTEAAGWFEQADNAAPAAIAGDVATYKTAHDQYASFLGTVDFNLDTVFSTPEGTQLAIETWHSLTPAIVGYAIDECGLSFGDEQQPPPTTTDHHIGAVTRPTVYSTCRAANGHLDQRYRRSGSCSSLSRPSVDSTNTKPCRS